MGVEHEQVRETGELMSLLAKTRKTLRLYQPDNVMCRRLEDELATRTAAYLECWGECELIVREGELLIGDDVVLEGGDGVESLPFLLFRDGIRRLTLLPGLEADELHDLLMILNRVGAVVGTEDDLVTLLWERDLPHIRYSAVEELSDEGRGPRFAEELADGFRRGEGGGGAGERVSIEDLKTPVAHLPVEVCQLSEEEVEVLQRELEADDSTSPAMLAAELAVELAVAEDDAEERRRLYASLARILGAFLGEERSAPAIHALLRLEDLARAPGASEQVVALADAVLRELAEPARVRGALGGLGSGAALAAGELRRFLGLLGERALPAVVGALGRLPTPSLRQELADAVVASNAAGARALADWVGSTPLDTAVQRDVLDVARRLAPVGGLAIIERFLLGDEPDVRRLAARSLPPVDDGRAGQLWLALLGDSDPVLRDAALRAVVRSGRAELAPHLEALATAPDFDAWSLADKLRLFGAVVRLAGDEALGWFREVLSTRRRRLFASRSARETVDAAVTAVRQLGTPAATELLAELAAAGDRVVRDACRRAMARVGGEGDV